MTRQDQPGSGEGHEGEGHESGEDFELRVEAMRAPSSPSRSSRSYSTHMTPFARLRGRSRVARLALGATALVVLFAVVTGAFALTRGGGLNGSNPISGALRSVLRVTPMPTATATRVAYPTPTLGQEARPALGPAPASCSPPAPSPRTLPATFSGAIGGSPVWIAAFDGPQATRYINPFGARHTRYGWMTPITFAIEPGFTDPVVMRGERLDNGEPLWMAALSLGQTDNGATPSVAVVLDPQQPGWTDFQHTSFGLNEDWAAWSGMLYIPAAGCYALHASWPGGSWRVTFAAG